MTIDILFDKIGSVFVVTFNRVAQNNAFTGSMAKILSDRLKTIVEDRSIRAVLLKGNGDHFMVGHDLNLYNGDMNAIQDQVLQKVQFFYTAIRDLCAMEKPVIAATHGKVTSAGINFVLASDLVMTADTAVFNTGFISDAMVPDGGATFFLPRKVGACRASELLLLSEDFSATQALDWGLVNRVVPAADLQTAALAWAEQIATGPTRAMGAAKRLMVRGFDQELNAQLSIEAVAWNNGIKTFDFREAIKAFVTKRLPKYIGT
jgi:2-(1,2-epoxy-1,2-dihydrophenyl)acetyl-CoA isomerase